jgi:hypothetical protein
LHHAPVVDHQLDRAEADAAERLPQLTEELGRERERVFVTVLQSGERMMGSHVPIYPICQIE